MYRVDLFCLFRKKKRLKRFHLKNFLKVQKQQVSRIGLFFMAYLSGKVVLINFFRRVIVIESVGNIIRLVHWLLLANSLHLTQAHPLRNIALSLGRHQGGLLVKHKPETTRNKRYENPAFQRNIHLNQE